MGIVTAVEYYIRSDLKSVWACLTSERLSSCIVNEQDVCTGWTEQHSGNEFDSIAVCLTPEKKKRKDCT